MGLLGCVLPVKCKIPYRLCWNNRQQNCVLYFYHPLNQDELECSLIEFFKVHPGPDTGGFFGRFKSEL